MAAGFEQIQAALDKQDFGLDFRFFTFGQIIQGCEGPIYGGFHPCLSFYVWLSKFSNLAPLVHGGHFDIGFHHLVRWLHIGTKRRISQDDIKAGFKDAVDV